MKTRKQANGKKKPVTFDAEAFLNSAGVARTMMAFERKKTLFSQGEPCKNVMYIQKGRVKISVVSQTGKEVVVGNMAPVTLSVREDWQGSQTEWQPPQPLRK